MDTGRAITPLLAACATGKNIVYKSSARTAIRLTVLLPGE